jgi:hypothetical protein
LSPGALNSADVHEHVIAATIRLDKPKTLLAVKPLYCACRHFSSPHHHKENPRYPPKRTARKFLLWNVSDLDWSLPPCGGYGRMRNLSTRRISLKVLQIVWLNFAWS